MVFSIPSSTQTITCSTVPRVFAPASTFIISCSVKFGGVGGARRRGRCSYLFLRASNLWTMAELLVEEKSSFSRAATCAAVTASSSASDQHEISPSRTFVDARTEQDFDFINRDQDQGLGETQEPQPLLFTDDRDGLRATVGGLELHLLLGIQKEAEAGRLPENIAQGMEELYYSYRNA
ncbi:hypothetical protein OROGR_010495 [Orobanche gracilis]